MTPPATTRPAVAALRREVRARRRALTPRLQMDHARQATLAVVRSGILLRSRTIGIYLAQHDDGELDPMPLISRLWSIGTAVALPVIHPARPTMDFYRFHPTTRLAANRFGIFEPASSSRRGPVHERTRVLYVNPRSIDIVFAPLVAFDAEGSRLGMGAGFYDRFLGALPQALRPLLVGLAHETQRVGEPLSRQAHDIPLDAVATESGWQAFTSRAKVRR